MDKELKDMLTQMQNQMNSIQSEMTKGFYNVNERLDKVENEVKQNSIKLESLDKSVQKLEKEVGELKLTVSENTLILTEVETRTRRLKESEIETKEEILNIHKILNVHSDDIYNIKRKINL